MDIAEGKIPARKARFLSVSGANTSVNKTTLERVRQFAGLRGYITNTPKMHVSDHYYWFISRSVAGKSVLLHDQA